MVVPINQGAILVVHKIILQEACQWFFVDKLPFILLFHYFIGKKYQPYSYILFFFTNLVFFYQDIFFSIPYFCAFAATVLCVNPKTLPALLKLPY